MVPALPSATAVYFPCPFAPLRGSQLGYVGIGDECLCPFAHASMTRYKRHCCAWMRGQPEEQEAQVSMGPYSLPPLPGSEEDRFADPMEP